tara:strand:+ start:676 stop:1440 length:765 start_codon:yes stop_codon:yes gene_type:complete
MDVLTNNDIVILILSAFITSSISAVLGMGGGIILLGIMAVIIPEGYKVIALHGMVQLFSNTTRTYVFRKYVKTQLIKQFFNGALIGISFSVGIIITLIYYFDVQSANEIKVEVLKPFIGLFIVWNLFLKGPKKAKIVKSFVPVGLVAGLSSIFVGAVGPLIAPFFLVKSFNKEHIIANKAAAQMITHLSKIPLFIYFFNMDYTAELKILIPLILAVYVGTSFGKKILYFIPELLFKKLFKITLFIISIRLILLS